ncbi:helix-turn-helix transcriptional regulator [Paenibacillus sp. MMS18-CY102]|uniref:helix-turn-helix transcriptional regulator n=1 Tax=Paenibacillus sp. MMS18-CY102 TaxID=2682849 RepID=UPI00192473D6|nr:helix-turn-helix transcriptional regulator [Paenibacillus sp. MMS18-CY102]
MGENVSHLSLGKFLRARRQRLTPEEVGLPSYGRRRTPGLRREEVAQLAHIGTSWYTSLEQDRDVSPSEEVLDSLAHALRLNADERRYLHMLAQPKRAKEEERAIKDASIGLTRIVKSLDPNPAFIMGRNWDLLEWNKAAEFVFQLPAFSKETHGHPNWMRRFLTDSSLRSNNTDWEAKAQVMIARFRADYAHFPNDARFKALIEEFMQASELFRETWPLHDVQAATDCHKHWSDPRIGEMVFEHVVLQLPNNSEMKIMVYTASSDTAIRLQELLTAGRPNSRNS